MLFGEDVEVGLADDAPGVAEAVPLGHRLADANEAALLVLEVDRVRNGVEQAVEKMPFKRRFVLGLFAFQELADLAAERREHLQQFVVRLLDFVAEELHDAEQHRRRSRPESRTRRANRPGPRPVRVESSDP